MGTVSKAVASREAPAAPATVHPIQALLSRFKPVIARLLAPTGMNEETFVAQIANACRANPALWNTRPESLLGAALRCAQLSLAPNDVRNLAWIVPYHGEATFQLGYGGVMELARRAEPGTRFDGHPVFPNDEFDLDYGKERPLRHRPHYVLGLERGGEAYLWWVRVRYPEGMQQVHALDRAAVEYHRSFSRQPDGLMWTRSYDAGALKSVVLDMRRWLPSSAQLVAALDADERVVDVEEIAEETEIAPGGEVAPPASDPPEEEGGGGAPDAEDVPTSSAQRRRRPPPPPLREEPPPEWETAES